MPRASRRTRWQLPLAAGLGLFLATACGDDEQPPGPAPVPPTYEATIRRTSHGIPHIQANDLGSLAYGQGYAFAQDHVCILADQILKVRGERARFHGAGPGQTYAGSDFAYLALGLHERAQANLEQQPEDLRQVLKGYAAGFNRYVSETPKDQLPPPCTNAAWVRPISDVDLLAYHFSLGLTGGAYQLILAIAAATPPAAPGAGSVGVPAPGSFRVERPAMHEVGSNGWAIGSQRSDNGRGMVVANPHFPWEGELKLWESHLTIPGQLNVYGVGLLGVPAVLIGFNENVAWTHTFSSGQRLTLYGLQLVPGKPTSYWYGQGENRVERQMTSRDFTILVRLPEGSLTNVTRRMYFSHYGPMIVIPGQAEWTQQTALTFRDANLENTALVRQFMGMNKAKSLDEFRQVYADVQGIPWVNTMAADRNGKVWYVDASPTPRLTDSAIARWRAASSGLDPLTTAVFRSLGLVLLDGGNPDNEWQNVPGARSPGLVPYADVPKFEEPRDDFVFNANDSYWLANPDAPLTGYSPLHGLERVPQSPRTRMNAVLLTERREGGASGADGRFTLDELKGAIFSNRSITAEQLRADVAARCADRTTVTYQGAQVDIRQACQVLAGWNDRFDTDSVGALVWREFGGTFTASELAAGAPLYANPFDPENPITTPNTLAPAPAQGDDPILTRLAQAVATLKRADIAVDRPLGEVQFSPRVNGERIPIHGGLGRDGVANVVSFGNLKSTTPGAEFTAQRGTVVTSTTGLTQAGYVVNSGTSFVMAMQFTDSGVSAQALLTYGESSDPRSASFADQTQLFSRKEWRPIRFTEAEIAADPALAPMTLSGD